MVANKNPKMYSFQWQTLQLIVVDTTTSTHCRLTTPFSCVQPTLVRSTANRCTEDGLHLSVVSN